MVDASAASIDGDAASWPQKYNADPWQIADGQYPGVGFNTQRTFPSVATMLFGSLMSTMR